MLDTVEKDKHSVSHCYDRIQYLAVRDWNLNICLRRNQFQPGEFSRFLSAFVYNLLHVSGCTMRVVLSWKWISGYYVYKVYSVVRSWTLISGCYTKSISTFRLVVRSWKVRKRKLLTFGICNRVVYKKHRRLIPPSQTKINDLIIARSRNLWLLLIK